MAISTSALSCGSMNDNRMPEGSCKDLALKAVSRRRRAASIFTCVWPPDLHESQVHAETFRSISICRQKGSKNRGPRGD